MRFRFSSLLTALKGKELIDLLNELESSPFSRHESKEVFVEYRTEGEWKGDTLTTRLIFKGFS